jgi:AcrR family transcriptional regulator
MTQTAVTPDAREDTRARIESAALDLFTAQGFEDVTIDEIAEAAGISRRTFFRHVGAKADAVWGDFDAHVLRLEAMLAAAARDQSVLASICAAYVEVNEPALQAHSLVRYAGVDRVVAAHVARRTGTAPDALVPRLVATSTRAAATTAFEVWLADGRLTLAAALHRAFDELAGGFPSLR